MHACLLCPQRHTATQPPGARNARRDRGSASSAAQVLRRGQSQHDPAWSSRNTARGSGQVRNNSKIQAYENLYLQQGHDRMTLSLVCWQWVSALGPLADPSDQPLPCRAAEEQRGRGSRGRTGSLQPSRDEPAERPGDSRKQLLPCPSPFVAQAWSVRERKHGFPEKLLSPPQENTSGPVAPVFLGNVGQIIYTEVFTGGY